LFLLILMFIDQLNSNIQITNYQQISIPNTEITN